MKTLDFILNLKHWQVFLILILCGFLKEFEWGGNQLITAFLSPIGFGVYAFYAVLVGHTLHHKFPNLISVNYKAFTLASTAWILVLFVGQFVSVMYDLNFMEILTIPGLLLVFLAGIYCMVFTSVMIEAVDSGKEVTFLESYGVFMLLLFMPIGIWFLQPMLNKATQGKLNEPSIQ